MLPSIISTILILTLAAVSARPSAVPAGHHEFNLARRDITLSNTKGDPVPSACQSVCNTYTSSLSTCAPDAAKSDGDIWSAKIEIEHCQCQPTIVNSFSPCLSCCSANGLFGHPSTAQAAVDDYNSKCFNSSTNGKPYVPITLTVPYVSSANSVSLKWEAGVAALLAAVLFTLI